jgi:hypothetical protein
MKIIRLFPKTLIGLCFTVAAYGMVLGAGTAHAQTFVNGGFEADVWTVGWTNQGVSPDGWVTLSSGDAEWPGGVRNSANTTNSYTPFGNQFIALCARDCNGVYEGHSPPLGNISQAVSGFVVGARYRLDFQHAPENHNNPPSPEDSIVNVSIAGGTPASTDFSAQPLGGNFSLWKAQSLVFTANATTLTFTFAGVATIRSDVESGIDNISVTRIDSVPIPTLSVYGLLLVMLGIIIVVSLRRRASAKRQ